MALKNRKTTTLILGVDASGKNHVANIAEEMIREAGHTVEKREGMFSGPITTAESSEDKSPVFLLLEKLFLLTFPVIKHMLPLLVTLIIKTDIKRYVKPRCNQVVISLTALRILVLYLESRFAREEDIKLPFHLHRELTRLAELTKPRAIALDVSDAVRKKRIASRAAAGKVDNFDLYMAEDGERSERIEAYMIWLARTYFDAETIINDNLTREQLRKLL